MANAVISEGLEISLKDMKLKSSDAKNYIGLVYYVKGAPKKKFVIVNYWSEVSPAYDGNYYSYRFEFAKLEDVLSGKRGGKISLGSFQGMGSMGAPKEYEPVPYTDVIVVARLKIKELKEVTKVVEKRGFSVSK